MAQYCPFFKKNYQKIAQDLKIPGYATDFEVIEKIVIKEWEKLAYYTECLLPF